MDTHRRSNPFQLMPPFLYEVDFYSKDFSPVFLCGDEMINTKNICLYICLLFRLLVQSTGKAVALTRCHRVDSRVQDCGIYA